MFSPPAWDTQHYYDTPVSMRLRRRSRGATAPGDGEGTSILAILEDHIRFNHLDSLAEELAKDSAELRSKINAIEVQGGTFALIHLAAQGGKIEAMQMLTDAGADFNLCSSDGQTPLDLAYQTNQQKAAIFLVENGAKFTPNQATVDRYFNGDVWTSTKNTGRTLLHWAARFGSLVAINAILSEGVPIDVQNDSGTTALHMACSFGQMDAAHLLLRRGASLQTRDYHGKCPLHKCKGGSDGPMATRIREMFRPLHAALKKNDLTHLLELLATETTELRQHDENGFTPFQCALLDSNKAACHAFLFQTTETVDLWSLSSAQVNRIRQFLADRTGPTPLSFVGTELTPLEACASQNNGMMLDWLLTLTFQLQTLSCCSSPLLSSKDLARAFINAAQRHADVAMKKLAEFGADIYQQLPQFISSYSTETLAQLSYGRLLPEELLRDLKAAYASSPKLHNWIRRRAFLEFLSRGGLYCGRPTSATALQEAGRLSVQEQVLGLDLCVTHVMSFL
jgi:ankyrin repeat protein